MRRDKILGMLGVVMMLAACAGGAPSSADSADMEAGQPGRTPSQRVAADETRDDLPSRAVQPVQRTLVEEQASQEEQAPEEGRSPVVQGADQTAAVETDADPRQDDSQAAEQARQLRERREREQAERERREALAREQEQKAARIAELERRIERNEAQVERIDEANRVLREALAAAERLNAALGEEQAKYETVDPETGELLTPPEPERIESLREEKDRLERRAETLMEAAGL